MKQIHTLKFILFFILLSTFLPAGLYSQRERTGRNPGRDNTGERHDPIGTNDGITDRKEERKRHTGIIIERPKRPDTEPIIPQEPNDPPANDPPAYDPPAYCPPTLQQPAPPVIIVVAPEEPLPPLYRPKEPEEPLDHIKIGLAKLDDLDYLGALEDFNYAIEEDTSNYKLYYYRGFALLNLKYYIEAVKDFNIYLNYFFYDMEGYFQRGLAKFYLKEKFNALYDFQTAAEMGHKWAASIIKRFY